MASVLGFVAFGVAVFALISDIIAVALDHWVDTSVGPFKTYYGLWKSCYGPETNVQCYEVGVTAEYAVVRAMVLLALFLVVGAIVCGGLKLFLWKDKGVLNKVACGLLAAAGLFLMIGFGVFVARIARIGLHAGFAFCVIAWIASWVASGLYGTLAKSDE